MLLQYHNLDEHQRAVAQSIQCAVIFETLMTKWDDMKKHCKPSFVEGVDHFFSNNAGLKPEAMLEKFVEYIESDDKVLGVQFHDMAEMAAMNVLYTTDAMNTKVINLDRHKHD
jgi:hypothetical protein